MSINSVGGGGANLPSNIEDLFKSAPSDVLQKLVDSKQSIASENEAVKQKLLAEMGAIRELNGETLAQILAAMSGKLPDAGGGANPLQAPEGKLGVDAGSTLNALSQLSEQEVQTDMYAFMMLFQQLAQTMRTSAREVRASELQAQVDTLKGAAEEMRNAAEERMIGAITQGAFQIAGGLVQMGAGFKQGSVLAGGGSEALAKSYSDKGAGISGVASGIGTIVNAAQERKAAEHDAKRSELEAQSKVHESGVQQANEMAQQMMDVIRDLRDKLSAIEQSRMETNRGIARNI
ncbi:type III secretion system translocon subunit SctB [Achromobacter sp. RTa]|uniref:type III secretion system translocon subunit SctB n=1 Tax=Achromobacter sp. RTa TaxID=1532557 RepID=UPI0006915000|nr:type III secretion system translocon subunit SctB [Achromobacter sp. RTa]